MSVQQENIQLFERTPIPQAVAKLALPTVVSSLVMVIYNLADTYFVGMLGDPIQNAAVTLVGPVLLAFNAVNNLFGVGTSSLMSRGMGAKEYENVKRTSNLGFYCALLAGILFSILCTIFKEPLLSLLGADVQTTATTGEYLFWTVSCGAMPAILNVVMAYMVRAEGGSLHASLGTMSGCVLNMILDPIFILPFGLNMGAAGAGLATFLSNCVACLYFFVLLLYKKRGNTFIRLSPRYFKPDKKILLGICVVGIPASIQNLLNVTGMTILNNFTASYGADAVAAMGISQKIAMIPLQITFGFTQGIMPLIGYNYACGNAKRMKASVTFALKLLLPVLICVSVLFSLGSNTVISVFMKTPSIVSYGGQFLRGFCLALPFLCVDFTAVGVFQSIGNGKAALYFAVLRKIVLEIPALFLLNALFPLYGLPYAQPLAEFILSIAAVIMLARIFRQTTGKSQPAREGSSE